MRSSFNWLLVLGVGVIAGCGDGPAKQPPAPVHTISLFRSHFAGTTRLVADTNAEPWISMSALPASKALWRQTLEKLAKSPYQFSRHRIAETNNDHASTFQELIADFVRAESFAEVTGDTNHITECELAIRLPADRAESWRTNLLAVLESWTGCRGERLPAGAIGWQLKKHHAPNLLRLVSSGDWILVGFGQDQLRLQAEYLHRIEQTGSPAPEKSDPLLGGVKGGSWLEIFLDCQSLSAIWSSAFGQQDASEPPEGPTPNPQPSILKSQFGLKGLPAVNFYLGARDSNLRLKGDFTFRDPFTWKLEPWQIPTNLIHDPIISFTAIQGFAPILKNHQEALGLRLDSMPGQLFVWAGANFPVQTLAAAPMKDATEFLNSLAPQLMARSNPDLQAHDAGWLLMTTNSSGAIALRWVGIPPFLEPSLSTAQDSGRDFLLAGVFPNWVGTNPPPVLFHQIAGRTNLVYYDWEITAEHAWAWRIIVNFFRHFFEKLQLENETASITWINAVSNRLGNTITEVTRSDSNRLSLVRQGPIGLTGIELIAMAHWLESTNFPLNGFALPARTNRVTDK